MLWVSATQNKSEKLLILLLMFIILGLICFLITAASLFWDIFTGKRGFYLHAIMFSCEIGVLVVSCLSIREEIKNGTFRGSGAYQSDMRFLIFSACMSVITTCLSIVGLERLRRVANGVSNRLNSVMPSDAGLSTWTRSRSKPLGLPEEAHEHLADQPLRLDISPASASAR